MRTAKFIIDTYAEMTFEGFTLDETWNGWARPYFTFEQAQRIVQAHTSWGGKAWYDEGEDVFMFEFSRDEVDAFPAESMDDRKLYPVGAGCWIWEEAVCIDRGHSGHMFADMVDTLQRLYLRLERSRSYAVESEFTSVSTSRIRPARLSRRSQRPPTVPPLRH